MIKRVGSTIVSPVAGFARGFGYPLKAVRFLAGHPGFIRFLAIPFVINLLVFSSAVYFGLDLFEGMLESYAPAGDIWYGMILYYLAWIVALLLTAVVVFFSFTVVGNLIASPFNELLSERVEQAVRGIQAEEPFRLKVFLSESRTAFLVELKKMTFFVLGMLLLFALNFIPGIGSLFYAILAPLFTLFFLAVEYMAFVLMRKQMNFSQQRSYIFKRPVLMIGFSCGIFLLLAIPFLQFFCIPLAVVGATLLWCEFPVVSADKES